MSVLAPPNEKLPMSPETRTCPYCHGKGAVLDKDVFLFNTCHECGGEGTIDQ